MTRAAPLAALLMAAVLSACAGEVNLLGGREKCWSENDLLVASLMKGWVELDTDPPVMHTPEGDDLSLSFPFMSIRQTDEGPVLTDDGATVAQNGELLTVFGGLGSAGSMVVCAVEEHHDG